MQRLALLCEALALAASLEIRADVVDNFNSGNDNGFLHFDTDIILHGAAGTPIGTFASYTFPSDGHGGFAYRLQTTALPPSVGTSAGPPRSFSFETNIYSRCITAVDILAWPTTWDEAFGLLYRANNVGPGTTDGYVMNYNAADRNLQINTIASEAPTTIAETHVVLDPSSNRYHWVLYTSGANFVGLVYQLPDTNNPVAEVIAKDSTTDSGLYGLLTFDRNSRSPYVGTDATFDNYSVITPAANALSAITVQLSPAPNASTMLAQPTVAIAVLDQETTADRSSFRFQIDGTAVATNLISVKEGVISSGNPIPFNGPTVSFSPATPQTNGLHIVTATYADNTGAKFTNTWSFTAAFLSTPSTIAPSTPGFSVYVVQAPQSPVLANTLTRALNQLSATSSIPRLYATNVVVTNINFSSKAIIGAIDSIFGNDLPIPGQIDDATINNWAMQVNTYLSLPTGVITMGIHSDDSYSLSSGNLLISQHDNGPGTATFSFYVAKAGLYPFTLIWEQAGGAAYIEWYEITPTAHADTANEVLINVADGYAAFTGLAVNLPPPTLLGATAARGPYTVAANATLDASAQTFTLPASTAAGAQYFEVQATTSLKLSAQIVGANLVIHYFQ